jgi:hypothetical protein
VEGLKAEKRCSYGEWTPSSIYEVSSPWITWTRASMLLRGEELDVICDSL